MIVATVLLIAWLMVQLRKNQKYLRINWGRTYTIKWYWLIVVFILFALLILALLLYLLVRYVRRMVNIDNNDMCLVREVPPLVLSKDVNLSEFNLPIAQTLCLLALNVTSWSVCGDEFRPPRVPDFELIATMKVFNLYSQAYQDNCVAYYSKTQDCLILCFAGTTSFDQWLASADFRNSVPPFLKEKAPNVKIHTTYWKMYDSIRPRVMEILQLTLGPKTKIFVTGHSLGGSFAAICYIDLIAHNLAKGRRSLYVFGTPRTGNKVFGEMISADNSSFRVSNSEDVIPSLPFPVMSDNYYSHFGQNVQFALNLKNLLFNHTNAYAEYLQPLERVYTTVFGNTSVSEDE